MFPSSPRIVSHDEVFGTDKENDAMLCYSFLEKNNQIAAFLANLANREEFVCTLRQ